MEGGAGEGAGGGRRAPYGRTASIAVAVHLVIVPRFLNVLTGFELAHEITGSDDWEVLAAMQRMTQLSYVAAGVLSYALFAVLFENCRRRTCLFVVCISQAATSALHICTNSYWLLHVSKAASAVSDVGAGMFCVIYVSEIAPDEIRGALVTIQHLFVFLSECLPEFMFSFDVRLKYLHYSCISIVTSVIVALFAYFAVPESPIYFLRRDDSAGAKQSLTILHGSDENVSRVIASRKKLLKATRSDAQTTTSVFEECIHRRTLKFTCVAIGFYFLRVALGSYGSLSQAVLLDWWSRTTISYNSKPVFEGFIAIMGNLFGLTLCDRLGRKILLLVSGLVSSVSEIVRGILYYLSIDDGIFSTTGVVMIMIFRAHIFCFNLGAFILPEVLISDIFPPKILNTQMAILGSFHLCIGYIILYPIDLPGNSPLKLHGHCWLYGGLSCVVALLMIKFLSETKCRPPGLKFVEREENVLFSSLRNGEQ
ncbi:hypothetical protein R5R35_004270 [Gryllus longicercus]|uniref:Major facilitator superfamily (MFS) profile domain-containing protein n=1 Tax=Gryllus longicercus TaxID=2509291 RepID=A0AAN9W473_9ORTH